MYDAPRWTPASSLQLGSDGPKVTCMLLAEKSCCLQRRPPPRWKNASFIRAFTALLKPNLTQHAIWHQSEIWLQLYNVSMAKYLHRGSKLHLKLWRKNWPGLFSTLHACKKREKYTILMGEGNLASEHLVAPVLSFDCFGTILTM
jgi:hypothetical protein